MWCIKLSMRQDLEKEDHRYHLRESLKQADVHRHRGGSDGQRQTYQISWLIPGDLALVALFLLLALSTWHV